MFREKIMGIGARVAEMLAEYPDIATTEAQTKNTLIEPFLRCLGYDPSHPEQVTLEVSTELGGKMDYVLTGQTKVKIAVEAKKAGVKLSEKGTNQLRSYFTFSEAVAGILTNGVVYWLFTDLDKTNVMDATPYRRVNVKHLTSNDIHHLKTLTRTQVQQSAVHEQARQDRYRPLVNEIVTQEFHSPSQDFLKLVGKRIGIKPLTKAAVELLRPLVVEAISQHLAKSHTSQQSGSPAQTQSKGPTLQVDSPSSTAGQKAAQTLKNFKGATLFGKSLSVTNYTQLLVTVATELSTLHPHRFADLVQSAPFYKQGRKWQWVSKDKADIFPDNPTRRVGDFYFDVVLNAKNKEKRARLLLERLGHDPDKDLEVHLITK